MKRKGQFDPLGKKIKVRAEGADVLNTAAHRGMVAGKNTLLFFYPTPSACGAVI
jgi:hypothetical protein